MGNTDCELCSRVYDGRPPCITGVWDNTPVCKPMKEPDLSGIDITALNVFGYLEPLRRYTIEPMSGFRDPVPFSFAELSEACKSVRNPQLVLELVVELEFTALNSLRALLAKEWQKNGSLKNRN